MVIVRWFVASLLAISFIAPVSSRGAEEDPTPSAAASSTEAGGSIPLRIVLPLRVAGTVISPSMRTALVVLLDEQGKEAGTVSVNEGETVQGYRLAKIQTDRVLFERDGQVFLITVRHTRSPMPSMAPDLPYKGKKEEPVEVAPSPTNIEEIRKGTETFFEKLRQDPEFSQQLEEVRTLLRQKLEAPEGSPSGR